jgi:hypothetical protein
MNPMKKLICAIFWLAALVVSPVFGQDKATPTPPAKAASPTLTKFDLDFPGGTPNELVAAIQKAMGRPLNAIVPEDSASLKLPPLKMKSVNVVQLFQALERASEISRVLPSGSGYSSFQAMFGFRTQDPVTDDSVWYFYYSGQQPQLPKISRFFLLTPYLDRGLTVDDITTAIQTGWKMAGTSPTPALSFHKETKLLIAVGDRNQLQTIDEVLGALRTPTPTTRATPDPEKTKP